MLDEFLRCSTPNSMFLASYIPTNGREEYEGETWIGRSDTSENRGYVYYRFSWIQSVCLERNLHVEDCLILLLENKFANYTHSQRKPQQIKNTSSSIII